MGCFSASSEAPGLFQDVKQATFSQGSIVASLITFLQLTGKLVLDFQDMVFTRAELSGVRSYKLQMVGISKQ